MAVNRRYAAYSGIRVDIPHLRSLESAVANDFDSVLRGLVTGIGKPYLMRGFDVVIPSASIQATSLTIKVGDSAVLHSTASEAGTILTVPPGTQDEVLSDTNSRVIGSFQNGVANYVSLDYRRVTDEASKDQTAGWVPSESLEVQRTVPIATVLDYRFVISTSSFGSLLPLYIVGVDNAGFITYITKAVDGLFRLGLGGSNPLPTYSFAYQNLVNPQTGNRREWINTNGAVSNPMSVVPGDDANAFKFGDWSITSLKEWMDAVMTRFKEITGSNYWYIDTAFGPVTPGQFNLFDVWWDSGAGSVLTGSGALSFNIILEATQPTAGIWQSKLTNTDVSPGDVYVKGRTSGTTGVVTSFVNNRLVINSVTNNQGFVVGETVEGRRLYRPLLSLFQLDDDFDSSLDSNRYARFTRIPNSSASYIQASSWSFFLNEVTVNTTAAHGFSAGQVVQLNDFAAGSNAPNGSFVIKSVLSATSFLIMVARPPTGSPTLLSANNVRLDNQTEHPYMPRFEVTGWSASGTTLTFTAKNHSFKAPKTITGSTTNGLQGISGVSDLTDLEVGMNINSPNFPADTYVRYIDTGSNFITTSRAATATGSASHVLSQNVDLVGLASTVSADQMVLNRRYAITGILPNRDVTVTMATTVTGTFVASTSAYVEPDVFTTNMTIEGAIPSIYNGEDVVAQIWSATEFMYILGPSSLPPQPVASGAIELDGVIAVSTVADPVEIKRIENDGANVRVTSYAPHNETAGGPKTVTIYGDPSLSTFIRTYTNVTVSLPTIAPAGITSMTRASNIVTVVTAAAHNLTSGESIQVSGSTPSTFDTASAVVTVLTSNSFTYASTGSNGSTSVQPTISKLNQFVMSGSDLPFAPAYVNGGSDNTFLNFPNNPYPGPIEWDGDIYIKGIIGDKYFKIPQTAIAAGTPTANAFNVDGQTGTAFLQDKEVAYILLERNESVSNGQNFSCAAGGAIIGATAPTDKSGNPLVAGDFVKFEDDPETRWFRIDSVSGNTINLVSDYTGLAPNAQQRPAASGPLVYAKGTYSTVFVEPHWLVENSPDVYWIAVRRDNGATNGKVYFRGLQLTAGESVDIGNQTDNNLLIYTGAGSEAATSPNYTQIDQSGNWKFSEPVTVVAVNPQTREVTFTAPPALGFQKGDRLQKVSGATTLNYIIANPETSRTVVLQEDVSGISNGDQMTYFRVDYAINDPDNLTLAIRKEDRELARVNTNLSKPIYDESAFLQQINMNGSGAVKSGDFIYKGTYPTNITALAWVLHGSANVSESIEGTPVTMPGGIFGSNSILVMVYYGSFNDGDAINQLGAQVGSRTVNNPGNPAFLAPAIPGDLNTGTELVLPPNRRTQIVSGTSFVVWPQNMTFRASSDPALAGEELMVVINDQVRQAEVDYRETFGGPKGKIRIGRSLPINTRIRARVLGSVGSIIASAASAVNLQLAYNAGNTIVTQIGVPVVITASDFASGGTAASFIGNVTIDGSDGTNITNGLFGPADQRFLIGKEANKPKEVWTGLAAVKTQVGWTNSGWKNMTAAQVTTNATATAVTGSPITVPSGYALRVCMTATGRNSAATGQASYRIEGLFTREGGNVTLVGSPSGMIIGQNGTGATTAFVFGIVNPGTVQGMVVGNSGETWYWTVTIEYQLVATSA